MLSIVKILTEEHFESYFSSQNDDLIFINLINIRHVIKTRKMADFSTDRKTKHRNPNIKIYLFSNS